MVVSFFYKSFMHKNHFLCCCDACECNDEAFERTDEVEAVC